MDLAKAVEVILTSSAMPILLSIALFVAFGAAFVYVNLLVGKLARPKLPNPEKLAVYECGEPTIGPGWVQFDLRFYIVALVFLVFDVEVALFYPWAVAYGSAAELAVQWDRASPPPRCVRRHWWICCSFSASCCWVLRIFGGLDTW